MLRMGAGRNAIYLARMGFDVEGVDISIESVNSAREAAAREGILIRLKWPIWKRSLGSPLSL